jgi:hypothetical protein
LQGASVKLSANTPSICNTGPSPTTGTWRAMSSALTSPSSASLWVRIS